MTLVCAQLNGSKYCYVSLTIKQSFVYRELSEQTFLFLAIQFNMSRLFAQSLKWSKHFYMTHKLDPIRCYHSRVDQRAMAMKEYSAFPKLQYYYSLTIRLFNVKSRTLIGRNLTPQQRCSQYILQPQPTGLLLSATQH